VITNFSLDNFKITDTRAKHNDTDYVSIGIQVGTNDPLTASQKMGDVNNGTHAVGLGLAAEIPQDVDVPVVFTYAIINNGHGNP
jgi:hypothetical protein